MPTLVLIHIGESFPEYINDCIKQLQSVSDIPVHVLINDMHRHKLMGKCMTLKWFHRQ